MKAKSEKHINKINLALAIVVAFAAWIYVVYNVNPTMTRTFSEIPIHYVGEEELAKNELAIKSSSVETISVTVKARRSALDDLKEEDIVVNADVSDAGKGENAISLTVSTPDGLSVEAQSESGITVAIEDRTSKDVPLMVSYESGNRGEPVAKEQSVEKVKVSGAESLVKKVDHAQLQLDSSKVKDKAKTFSVKPKAVDSSHAAVPYVTVEPGKVSVTAVSGVTKTVNLKVRVKNPEDSGYKRSYTAPNKITVKGTEKALKGVTSVETVTVDLSAVTSSQDIPLEYELPEGVYVANASAGLSLSVKVAGLASKTFEIAGGNVAITGLGEGLSASLSEGSVSVTATGTEAQLSALSASSFKISVDASGLEAGSHTLTPKLSYHADLSKAVLDPGSVVIIIS